MRVDFLEIAQIELDRVPIREVGRISEEHKFLRVVLLKDGETVHNAFFDRSFKEGGQ